VGDEGVGGVAVGSLGVPLDEGRSSDNVACGCLIGSDAPSSAVAGSHEGSHDVLVVFLSPSGCADARAARASAKARGNSRPRFSARRKIPAAALGLKKNLSGTVSNSTSANDEDASPPLGHSEVTTVQHSPGEVVKPDVAQRADHDGEITSVGGTEQAGDVLNDDPPGWSNKLIGTAGELEEQPGSFSCEPCASAGDAEVLAQLREASTENVNAGVGAPTPVPIRIVPISSCRGSSIISSDHPHASEASI
jgi:hypothetical protein